MTSVGESGKMKIIKEAKDNIDCVCGISRVVDTAYSKRCFLNEV